MPDAVPALAVTAAMAGIPFGISGIGSLHDKECDRIEALIAELAKLGMLAETEEYGTVLSWDGSRRPISELPVSILYGDHRMAMALAPRGRVRSGDSDTRRRSSGKVLPRLLGRPAPRRIHRRRRRRGICRRMTIILILLVAIAGTGAALYAEHRFHLRRKGLEACGARRRAAAGRVLRNAHHLRARLLAGLRVGTNRILR